MLAGDFPDDGQAEAAAVAGLPGRSIEALADPASRALAAQLAGGEVDELTRLLGVSAEVVRGQLREG